MTEHIQELPVTEHQLQKAYFEWVRLKAVKDWRYRLIFAVPNAARRSYALAARMKAEGLLPGVPDVCVPLKARDGGVLFLEFKTGKGKLSADQVQVIEYLRKAGNSVSVVRSLKDAKAITTGWINGYA